MRFSDCLIFSILTLKNTIFETKPYHLSMKKVFLLLVILFSINGFACTCIKPEVKKAFEGAGSIFIGEVIRVDTTHFNQSGYSIYIYT